MKQLLSLATVWIKKPALIGFFSLYSALGFTQDYQKQQNEIFVFNVLSNGVVGGIGGAINKEDNEKFWPVFAKNFGRGCLGGVVKYAAKYQTYYMRNDYNVHLAPLNRAFFFLGHSMTMNASMNEKLLSQYYCNLYGLNFYVRPRTTDQNRFKVRLSLGTIGSAIRLSLQGDRLNVFKSLEYGLLFFDLNSQASSQGQTVGGRALYNVMAIRKNNLNSYLQSVVPHELVHVYQIYDYFPLSSMYQSKLDPLLHKIKGYDAVTKYVDFDFQAGFFLTFYGLQPQPKYYQNFFEYEAQHFSTRKYIER